MNKHFTLLLTCLIISTATIFADICQPLDITWLQTGQAGFDDGFYTDDATVWVYNPTYGAYARKDARTQGGCTGWLLTPVQNLRNANTVTLIFSHAHRFAGTPSNELTLWVCAEFTGDIATADWQQITIPNYTTQANWTFVANSITIPVTMVGANTVFGFKYISTSTNYASWEIKDLNLTVTYAADADCSADDGRIGRLRVCAQNLQDYYYNYEGMSISYSDDAGRAAKTNKIVNMMLTMNADLYAFCEVEPQPIVLAQLADSLNVRLGVDGLYAAVNDGINYTPPTGRDYSNLKSGFIYRTDKVRPIGANTSPYNSGVYNYRLRIQAFEELSSNERFVVSMNHFKAKVGSNDTDNTRQLNADNLISALTTRSYVDSDILILGDLNCLVDEAPLVTIAEAGFTEQILLYDANAYSHCYGGGELIDHVFANASMAEQIANVFIYHNCTSSDYCEGYRPATSYSDHDPYVVELNLASSTSDECVELSASHLATGGSNLGQMTAQSLSGQYNWRYQSAYGATCLDKGGEDWLLTPTYDLRNAKYVTLAFDHTINYANIADMTTQHTLWVTSNYADIASSEWEQLTIPTYPAGNNWTFVHSGDIQVPLEKVGANTVFAFKYNVPASATSGPTWEIKNLSITAGCEDIVSATPETQAETIQKAVRLIENGQLYILLPDGQRFTILGVQVP